MTSNISSGATVAPTIPNSMLLGDPKTKWPLWLEQKPATQPWPIDAGIVIGGIGWLGEGEDDVVRMCRRLEANGLRAIPGTSHVLSAHHGSVYTDWFEPDTLIEPLRRIKRFAQVGYRVQALDLEAYDEEGDYRKGNPRHDHDWPKRYPEWPEFGALLNTNGHFWSEVAKLGVTLLLLPSAAEPAEQPLWFSVNRRIPVCLFAEDTYDDGFGAATIGWANWSVLGCEYRPGFYARSYLPDRVAALRAAIGLRFWLYAPKPGYDKLFVPPAAVPPPAAATT